MPTSPPSNVAVVMTVRDERDFLRKNLLYHRFLGVSHFYVYDDGSTDGTVDTVSDLPYVDWSPSVPVDAVEITPDLAAAAARYDDYFVGRQLLNTQHAMNRARSDGYRWMVFIDADELVSVDRSHAEPDALNRFLNDQKASTDAVVFPTLEVVQRRVSYEDVLTQETLFKVANAGETRETYDPFLNQRRRIDAVYGHKAGKTAVRLDIESVPWSSHRFRAPGGKKLRTVERGDLLHYYAPDFEQFVHKFRIMKDHPDTHVDGRTVVVQKRLWRDVVNKSSMTDDELRDYYEKWVMFTDEQQQQMRGKRGLLGRKPALVQVTSAAEVLKRLESEDLAQAGAHR